MFDANLCSFGLDADIAMSELRSEETLTERLHRHPALRLRRRNDVLAVLVTADRWREIEQQLATLQATIEQHEQSAVDAIISERAARADFVPLTDTAWASITEEFQKSIS